MSEITYRPNKKVFVSGVVFTVLGAVILLLVYRTIRIGVGRIPVSGTLLSPFLVAIGLYQCVKSMKAPFCQACHTSLIEKEDFYPREVYPLIQSLMRGKPMENQFISPTRERTANTVSVSFDYCPACVSIGRIHVKDKTASQEIPLTVIHGPAVRHLRDLLVM